MLATPELEIHQDIPLKDKLIKKGFWLYFFAFLVAPAGYAIKVMISRELDVGEIGVVYSIIGLIGIISSYNDLGLTEALQYYLPHYLIDKEYNKAKTIMIVTWIMQFVTGVVIGGVLFFLAPWIATHYLHSPEAFTVLRIFCLYFLVINLFQVLQSIFIATQEVKWYNGVDAVRMWMVAGFVGVIILGDSLTMQYFAWSWIAGLIVGMIFAGGFFWKKFGWLIQNHSFERDRSLIAKQGKYAIWVMLGMNVGTILGQIDQQFAIYFLGPKSAGYWANYLSLQTAVNVFTMPLIIYLFPLFNELEKKGDKIRLLLLHKYLHWGVAVFGVLVAVVGWFGGPWIATLLFGEQFAFSGELFRYIAPFVWLNVLVAISFQQLASKGLVRQRVLILWIALVINAVVGYVAIQYMDLFGLIVGTVVSRVVLWIGANMVMSRNIRYK